jgi:hypothetical protein
MTERLSTHTDGSYRLRPGHRLERETRARHAGFNGLRRLRLRDSSLASGGASFRWTPATLTEHSTKRVVTHLRHRWLGRCYRCSRPSRPLRLTALR